MILIYMCLIWSLKVIDKKYRKNVAISGSSDYITHMTNTTTTPATTISYIASPSSRINKRCTWWAKRIPAGFAASIKLDDKDSLHPLPWLNRNADIELEEGEAVLSSEQINAYHNRGYLTTLDLVLDGKLYQLEYGADLKASIKSLATPEQWMELKDGSGDIVACLRYLKALALFDREQIATLAEFLHEV